MIPYDEPWPYDGGSGRPEDQRDLEQLIRRMARGRIAISPIAVADILLDAEFYLRYVPSLFDLEAAIRRLVLARRIGEVPGHRFVDARSSAASREHSPISRETFDAVVMSQPSADARPNSPAVSVTIAAGGGKPTTELWRRTEKLAIAMVDELRRHHRLATVMSITQGPEVIGFTILTDPNSDPDHVRRQVEPLVSDSGLSGIILANVGPRLPG